MNNYNYFDTFNNTFLSDNNYDLFGPYEGYVKGNLFKNLYSQYKNYSPVNLTITSEQDEQLLNINQIWFAMHELQLLLDIYPDNQNYINLFSKYEKQYNELLSSYQEKYGPINNNAIGNTTPFSWVSTSFPWEVK